MNVQVTRNYTLHDQHFFTFILGGNLAVVGNANLTDIANHFEHIKRRIGARHLCIGGDYNGVSSLPDGAEDVGKV